MFKKKKSAKKKASLKDKYDKLMKEGQKIFDHWNQKDKPPKRLIVIQKQLIKLRKKIKQQHIDEDLEFYAEHPEVYEFLPSEWT